MGQPIRAMSPQARINRLSRKHSDPQEGAQAGVMGKDEAAMGGEGPLVCSRQKWTGYMSV